MAEITIISFCFFELTGFFFNYEHFQPHLSKKKNRNDINIIQRSAEGSRWLSKKKTIYMYFLFEAANEETEE